MKGWAEEHQYVLQVLAEHGLLQLIVCGAGVDGNGAGEVAGVSPQDVILQH